MKRKCSLCGEYKEESEFRYMNKQKRFNAYCKECEKWYHRHYVRKEKGKSYESNKGRKSAL